MKSHYILTLQLFTDKRFKSFVTHGHDHPPSYHRVIPALYRSYGSGYAADRFIPLSYYTGNSLLFFRLTYSILFFNKMISVVFAHSPVVIFKFIYYTVLHCKNGFTGSIQYKSIKRGAIIMKSLKQHANSIILCLFEILVGILLLIDPEKFTSAIIMAFGVILVLIGEICGIGYFRLDAAQAAASQSLFKGLFALIAGIFCVTRCDWFIAMFPILAILYGVAVLIAGLMKIQWTVDIIRLKLGKWWGLPALSAVISLICSIIILKNPFGAVYILWIFTGVSLIVEAVLDISALFVISSISRTDQTSR